MPKPMFEEGVYLCRLDGKFEGLAISPRVQADGMVSWFDTLRERGLYGVLKVQDNHLELATEDGITVVFEPLTLENYEAEVRRTVDGAPGFDSTAELRAFYLQNF